MYMDGNSFKAYTPIFFEVGKNADYNVDVRYVLRSVLLTVSFKTHKKYFKVQYCSLEDKKYYQILSKMLF